MSTKKQTQEWEPITVTAAPDETFRPILVGSTAAPVADNQAAAPAANSKPATGKKED